MAVISDILNNDAVRSVVVVLLLIGTFALLLTDRDVPTFLIAIDGAAVGFYFGGIPAKSSR